MQLINKTASYAHTSKLYNIWHILAVVNQRYEPEVQNPGGFIGSNVLIKCNIPSFVKEYVTVTSWLQEPNFNIYPSLEGGNCNKSKRQGVIFFFN